jgi:hypothetical protein
MDKLIEAIKNEFAKACEFDGLEANTVFAVFSKDNPHAKKHDRLMRIFFAARKAQI